MYLFVWLCPVFIQHVGQTWAPCMRRGFSATGDWEMQLALFPDNTKLWLGAQFTWRKST